MKEEKQLLDDFLLAAAELKKTYLDKRLKKNEIAYLSVDRSTIRSFHHAKECSKKYRPLSIFRCWAWKYLSEENMRGWIEERNFSGLRDHAYESLKKYWATADGGIPSFAQYNKLIDLFFKHLCLLDELSDDEREFIFNHSQVPLDKYSLGFLGRIAPDLNISGQPRMGDVSEFNYPIFQRRITEICLDIAPLTFDLYAWNRSVNTIPTAFELIPLKK